VQKYLFSVISKFALHHKFVILLMTSLQNDAGIKAFRTKNVVQP